MTEIIILAVSPVDADKIYQALGKLPAESVETLRLVLRQQYEDQKGLLQQLLDNPSVQQATEGGPK